ncbi:hypothetical protein HanIR_Chr09g0424041 [Helianthus annuus]|nr:hypothetical protein HanIR_Chr09g0424041 [Helianthus annuus]
MSLLLGQKCIEPATRRWDRFFEGLDRFFIYFFIFNPINLNNIYDTFWFLRPV